MASEDSLDRLPDELLVLIVSCIAQGDRCRVGRCSKRLYRLSLPLIWRVISVSADWGVLKQTCASLCRKNSHVAPLVRYFDLREAHPSDSAADRQLEIVHTIMAAMVQLVNLRVLVWAGWGVGLDAFTGCTFPHLIALRIGWNSTVRRSHNMKLNSSLDESADFFARHRGIEALHVSFDFTVDDFLTMGSPGPLTYLSVQLFSFIRILKHAAVDPSFRPLAPGCYVKLGGYSSTTATALCMAIKQSMWQIGTLELSRAVLSAFETQHHAVAVTGIAGLHVPMSLDTVVRNPCPNRRRRLTLLSCRKD